MNAVYTTLTLQLCRRCDNPVLAGVIAGFDLRVDTAKVPPAHAAVLVRYRYVVLIAEVRRTGIHADLWSPTTHRLTNPERCLLSEHACTRVLDGRRWPA